MENLSLKDFEYISSQYIKSLENNVYLTDGLVITLNQNNYDLEDKTGHHYRWNCCYKFQSDVKETTILDIIYQVGRTGKITPVASVEPTELSGAIIERVTLHNYKLVKENKLKKGDKILITRANEVIPKFIDKTFSSDVDFDDLCFCPACNHPLYISVSGIDLICESPNCKDKSIARLLHFVTTHKIDNISTSTIEKMYNDGLFTSDMDFLSFFKMADNDIMRLEGFGEKSANNIIDSIYRVKKNMNATDFIASLGLPNIGKFVANKLIEKFGMIENITTDGLENIDGVGDVIVESIKTNLPYISNIYEAFKNENIKFVYAENNIAEVKGGVLIGKKFILSGSFSKKKADIEKMIKDNGGLILSSVNNELDYLVTNETGTSKYIKAQKLNKNIITEDELLKML
jgi:DNA ligase (NAD+)